MFGEKKTEVIKGVECPVWQTPKYLASKDKALEMLNKGEYGLVEGDFWILMNTYANGQFDIVIGANEENTTYTELGAKCVSFGKDVLLFRPNNLQPVFKTIDK